MTATPLDERWFSAVELAGLPGLPGTERGVLKAAGRDGWEFRRKSKGKGNEYSFNSLPQSARVALLKRHAPPVTAKPKPAPRSRARGEVRHVSEDEMAHAAAYYEQLPDKRKVVAQGRLRALLEVKALCDAGAGRAQARVTVAGRYAKAGVRGFSAINLHRFAVMVGDAPVSQWLVLLCDHHADHYPGRKWGAKPADVSPQAQAMFKALYLDRKRLNFTACYRMVAAAAQAKGWAWPAIKTVRRWLENTVPIEQRVYLREGEQALDRLYPPVTRDRSMFAAMEAVNGDGVLFDRWCVFETGELARPKVWFWQCLMSAKLLAWRADVSENTEMLRLAFGDMVDQWGLPRMVFIDNTMAAANKTMSGGAKGKRFRTWKRKVRDEDAMGIFPLCGVEVHFTLPGHGQSKPIERAFRDLRTVMDHHPAFGDRGTKDNPLLIEEFMAVLADVVAAHNARTGRRGGHFEGRSFDEVFAESYARVPVRKATPEQRRLWLLTAEQVLVSRVNGSIVLGRSDVGENRYQCQELLAYMGQRVVVRFDPQKLHEPVHVYQLNGAYIGCAPCTWRGGFADQTLAQAFSRAKGTFKKGTKLAAKGQTQMDALEAARLVPQTERAAVPVPTVVKGQFGKRKGAKEEGLPGVDEGMGTVVEMETAESRKRRENYQAYLKRVEKQHDEEHWMDAVGHR